ncbi:hypothetical protein OBBRIDRAFT_888915 [Obba rivulosa]|uniref:Uncharacterized protein n=1 Tax=Obba rivulosa TaxID=1052685 RepID=A0A8E2DJ47_9APHY|nr:hypothetical protein OBBRIDRAFT_888915 [Obba rivulosa]
MDSAGVNLECTARSHENRCPRRPAIVRPHKSGWSLSSFEGPLLHDLSNSVDVVQLRMSDTEEDNQRLSPGGLGSPVAGPVMHRCQCRWRFTLEEHRGAYKVPPLPRMFPAPCWRPPVLPHTLPLLAKCSSLALSRSRPPAPLRPSSSPLRQPPPPLPCPRQMLPMLETTLNQSVVIAISHDPRTSRRWHVCALTRTLMPRSRVSSWSGDMIVTTSEYSRTVLDES